MKGTERFQEWRGRFIRYAPLLIWAGLIFLLSSSVGASSRSSFLVRPFLEWIFPLAAEETLAVYHGYVRKFAHLFMYGGLAILASRAFRGSSVTVLKVNPFATSMMVVLAIGSLDEFNQSFNTSRTGTVFDVILDLVGGLLALILARIYRATGR